MTEPQSLEDKNIGWLISAIESSPHDYNAHQSLIEALREAKRWDQVHLRRQHMSSIFPLTSDHWLSWLTDVFCLLQQEEQRDYIPLLEMHDRALSEVPSVDIARSYVSTVVAANVYNSEVIPVLTVRQVMSKCLKTSGYHLDKCSALWRDVLDWEEALLEGDMQPSDAATQVVRDLYSRQMKVPMEGLKEAWEEYEEWEENASKLEGTRKVYTATLKLVKPRAKHEKKFKSGGDAVYNAAIAYVDYETQQFNRQKGAKDPSLVCAIYERALEQFYGGEDLWLRYASFVSVSKPAELADTLRRACRHLPWSGKTAVYYSQCLEDKAAAVAYLSSSIAGAASGGVDSVHQVYVELETRLYAAEDFQTLSETIEVHKKSLPTDRGDLLGDITSLEARIAKSDEQFDQIWKKRMGQKGSATYWTLWHTYISGLVSRQPEGWVDRVRGIYRSATQKVSDYPALAFDSYLKFEREYGTPPTTLSASMLIDGRYRALLQVQERAAAAAKRKRTVPEYDLEEEDDVDGEKRRKTRSDASKRAYTVFFKNLPFGVPEGQIRTRFAAYGEVVEVRLIKDKEGKSRGFGFVEYSTTGAATGALAANGTFVQGRAMHVSQSTSGVGETGDAMLTTVYATNLPYDAAEQDVIQAFTTGVEGASVTSVRFVKDKKTNENKGSAFVEFADNTTGKKALLLSGALLCKGRPIYVEAPKSNEKKKQEGKTGASTRGEKKKRVAVDQGDYDDSCTVFVGNISTEASAQDLKDVLRTACGPVKSVRLAEAREGGHRGRAYVDFERAEDRQTAVAIGNKLELKGQILDISAPKPRQKGKSMKGTPFVSTGPPLTSLKPRAVKMKNTDFSQLFKKKK